MKEKQKVVNLEGRILLFTMTRVPLCMSVLVIYKRFANHYLKVMND